MYGTLPSLTPQKYVGMVWDCCNVNKHCQLSAVCPRVASWFLFAASIWIITISTDAHPLCEQPAAPCYQKKEICYGSRN
jgi:hypothetical protein